MLPMLAAFVLWTFYFALSGRGLVTAGVIAGLLTAAALNLWRLRAGKVKTMEMVALAFFAAHFVVTVALGSSLFRACDALLVNGTLAAVAWGTLLKGSPFTCEYARDKWPPEIWESPLFKRTNEIITAAWGLVFLINAGLGALALMWPVGRPWLSEALPPANIAAGIAFSLIFSRRYPRWRLTADLTSREPYRWPPPAFATRRPESKMQHDVIVVGAGLGGLAAGALLARRGLKVLVVEQHYLAGGYCTSWPRIVRQGEKRLRYVFDAGVHDVSGLGPRGPVRNLLRRLDLETRLEWRPMSHEYILPGFRIKVPRKPEEFLAALATRFPGERQALSAFFAEMERIYQELYADAERTGGVPCPPRAVDEMLAYPIRHPHAFRWMNVPFSAMLDRHFTSPRLKEALSVLTGYLSDDPKALTVGSMAPIFGYYFDGGYYPVGGSQALADALVSVIENHEGRVLLRTPARRILVENGRAAGIELATGEIHSAEAVVSNADARQTFLKLIGRQHLPDDFADRIAALAPSTSAFTVFLGVDSVPGIEPITFLRTDRESVYIAIPSKVDPSLAPPGHASLSLITLVPQPEAAGWDRRSPEYAARKRQFGDALIALAEQVLPGLSERIVYRQDATPATFARYARAPGGAIYGPAAGQWRPPAKSPIRGLVLAGASVFPGAGVEAVVISGTLAADALSGAEAPARG